MKKQPITTKVKIMDGFMRWWVATCYW